MLAAFDGIAHLADFACEGVPIDFRQVTGAFKYGQSFEGEQPGV